MPRTREEIRREIESLKSLIAFAENAYNHMLSLSDGAGGAGFVTKSREIDRYEKKITALEEELADPAVCEGS